MEKKFRYFILVTVVAFLTSCSDYSIDSGVYTGEESMHDTDTYACTVLSRRIVKVAGYNTHDNTAGKLTGALAGGLLGSAFGSGSGKIGMAAVGALGGAMAGNAIQSATKNKTKQSAFEYIVKLDVTGQLKTIVQGMNVDIPKGARAYLVSDKRNSSRSRLIPMD